MPFDILDVDITIAAIMFLFTSYLDIRKREVEDKVWIVFGIIGAASLVYQGVTSTVDWFSVGISIGLTTLIGLGLFYFGFYGGADGKALIVFSLFIPLYNPAIGLYSLAPIIVLTNGVLISMLLPAALLTLNISRLIRKQPIFEGFEEPLYRKVLACLLGYKQLDRPRSFQFSLERKELAETGSGQKEDKPQKKFDFSLARDDFEDSPNTWVTPGIPLLVFFTAGFFSLLLYGDLVIGLIHFFVQIV